MASRRQPTYERVRLLQWIDEEIAKEAKPSAVEAGRQTAIRAYNAHVAGELWALKAILELAAQSLVHIAAYRLRGPKAKIHVQRMRRTVAIARRYAIRPRDEHGLPDGPAQYPLWSTEEWPTLYEIRRHQATAHNTTGANLAALDEVLRLKARYPKSKTPLEACQKAGIDPWQFDLRLAAGDG